MPSVVRLEAEGFARARSHLLERARPLERALFRFEFETGPRAEVLAALTAYQNDDGGFGRALEPDLRLPDSSATATSIAFQILREVGADPDEPLAVRGLGWLRDAWDDAHPGWLDVPASVAEHPHAPWWDRPAERAPAPVDDAHWANPNAELIGVLWEHAEQLPAEELAARTAVLAERLRAWPSPLPPYSALCCLRVLGRLPAPLAKALDARLQADARHILDLDPAARAADHFPLWWLAPTPDAALAPALAPELGAELDRWIGTQHEDGYWEPGWAWDDRWPEAWAGAREEWRGELTLRFLRCLRAWGRIAPGALGGPGAGHAG